MYRKAHDLSEDNLPTLNASVFRPSSEHVRQ